MKTVIWIGLAFVCALLTQAETSLAEEARCQVRVGHERPAGCAPFSSRAVEPRAKRKKRSQQPGAPSLPFVDAIRAPKYESQKRHSERLLIRELARTEELLKSTPKGAPDRARIIRRLAEGYAELERLAQIRRLRAELRKAREDEKNSKR